jgi:hypothetical protein
MFLRRGWLLRSRVAKAWAARVALTSVLLSLLAFGCKTAEIPLAPRSPSTAVLQSDDLLGFATKGVLRFLKPPDLTSSRHTSKLIRAATGGSVQLSGFRVDIPPGALARDTFITIDLPTSLPAANYVVADFGPDGLRFAKAVRLTLPLTGVNLAGIELAAVKIWLWNGTQWVSPRGKASPSVVQGWTTHFSVYGARGVDTTSGG